MESSISIVLIFSIGALFVAVIAAIVNNAKAGKLSDTNARLRGAISALEKACKRLTLNAVRKNTITDDWECKLCGDLPDRDDGGHHSECPVWLAKVAISKAEETT